MLSSVCSPAASPGGFSPAGRSSPAPGAPASETPMHAGKKGFTLIELLVVIAVIGILAGMIFPVFSAARAKARQAACLSNVRQLCLAVQMYADDHDEVL